MARHGDLDRLLCDLRSFLLILDRESLSAEARAKKKSVAELLRRLQSPQSEDAEYMSMRCLSPSSGPPQGRDNSGTRTQDARGGRACERRLGNTQSPHGGSTSPSTSPSPPPDDSYEDTEPFGPGGHGGGSGGADTDSSHYESYGEDEDGAPLPDRAQDRAHYLRRPPASGPPLPTEPPGRPEAQLCGFLWRKRWLGRWAKQLFIVREHALLGFRRAADPQPVLELELRGCRVASKGTGSKKLPRALKVTGPAGEALVIGFPSRQQAEDWRKVIEEVSSNSPSGLAPHSPPASPPSRALRLGSKEEEEQEEASHNPREDPKGGFLALRLRGHWRRLWCTVQGALHRFPEENGGGAPGPVCALLLDGCEVTPGPPGGSPRRLQIRVAQRGRELALLQARSEEQREAWLKTLRARGGRGGGRCQPPGGAPQAGRRSRRVAAAPLPDPQRLHGRPLRAPQHGEAAAELGRSRAQAAPETRVRTARRRLQQPRALAGSASSQQGFLPSPAHPDAAREERGSGRFGFPHREEESAPQAGGEGGAAGEGLQGEEQAESWLRDEPAGHRQVPEGPHRRHRQLGCLRGLLPLPAPEAHGVRPQRPEALALGGRRGEGKSPPAEKGVGDEGCEVSGTGAAPATPGTSQPNLVLHVDRAGPAGSLATSIDAAPTPA